MGNYNDMLPPPRAQMQTLDTSVAHGLVVNHGIASMGPLHNTPPIPGGLPERTAPEYNDPMTNDEWEQLCIEAEAARYPDEPAPPSDMVPLDMVIRPHHYARYVIEPATFIAANKLPFDVGNVIKYITRYDAKNGIEDVLKAKRYCDMLLERLYREARVAAGDNAADVWKECL